MPPVQKVWTSGFDNITDAGYVDFDSLPDGTLLGLTIGNNQYNFTKLQLETFIGALAAAGYLAKANNLSDLANAATARTNLGLGGLAILDPADLESGGSDELEIALSQIPEIDAQASTFLGASTLLAQQQALDLEPGVDVQAYDADTAKIDVVQAWPADQDFSENISVAKNLELAQTTSATVGLVTVGGSRFISTYEVSGTSGKNLFIGRDAGNFTMSGTGANASYNVGLGYEALNGLTSAQGDVAIGYNAGKAVTSGSFGVFIGYLAGAGITTAPNVVAVGKSAAENATGSSLVLIGTGAGQNSTGSNLMCLGTNAGTSLSSGANIVMIGTNAGQFGTTPTGAVAIGTQSQQYVTTGTDNVSVGFNSLRGDSVGYSTGQRNVAIGRNAGLSFTTGSNNVLIGYNTGNALTTGSGNILIGYNLTATTATTSDELSIGGVLKGNLSTGKLYVTGDTFGINTSKTPASASDTGTAGQIAWDSSYIYVCTAANTWKRSAIATW